MPDEIEFLEEDEENNIVKPEEGKTKKSGRAVATAAGLIGIQLSGAALAVVIGFAYVMIMEVIGIVGIEDSVGVVLSIVFSIILLAINAWIFYFRGNKIAAVAWSSGVYYLLTFYFLPSELLAFVVVGLFVLTLYVLVKRDFTGMPTFKESVFLKKNSKLLWVLILIVSVGATVFFFLGSNSPVSSSRTSTKSRPAEIPGTPVPMVAVPENPVIGSSWFQAKDGMTLAYVPAGGFEMGRKAYQEDGPVHTVYLDAYWIDQTEITNVMYAKCVSAGVCELPRNRSYIYDDYYISVEFDDYPVMQVSWDDANAYCIWAERRLPTEAEWEKAARGGLESKKFPWGDMAPVCEYGVENGAKFYDLPGCNNTGTEKVASYFPNGYGIYDMAGNLWEWVADWHAVDYYANSPSSNPLGPSVGDSKVVRGGSWNYSEADALHVTNRINILPSTLSTSRGFRCARTP